MDQTVLHQGIQSLAHDGLNLFAAVSCDQLPDKIKIYIQKANIPLDKYRTIVLIGHGGKRLWEAMTPTDWEQPDPIDNYSQTKTEQFYSHYLGGWDNLLLFPTELLIPLQQLGEFVGWSHPSPLGLGINPEFGVWFAYRAAFLTTAVLPQITATPKPSPCITCVEKPCIKSCPGKATHPSNPFHIEACATHRLKESSSCHDRCLARIACPFFPEHQYSLPQIQYHYELSRITFEDYFPHLKSTQ